MCINSSVDLVGYDVDLIRASRAKSNVGGSIPPLSKALPMQHHLFVRLLVLGGRSFAPSLAQRESRMDSAAASTL